MTLAPVITASGSNFRTIAWIASAAAVVIVIALIVWVVRHPRRYHPDRPAGPADTTPPDPRYTWGSDFYWRSYHARDLAPPGRRAMGLPDFHHESDFRRL